MVDLQKSSCSNDYTDADEKVRCDDNTKTLPTCTKYHSDNLLNVKVTTIQIGPRSCINMIDQRSHRSEKVEKVYLLVLVKVHRCTSSHTIETLTTHTPCTVIIVALVINPLFSRRRSSTQKRQNNIPAITITRWISHGRHNVVFRLFIIPSPPFSHCLQCSLSSNRSRSHS
jgi:hypothetical protein